MLSSTFTLSRAIPMSDGSMRAPRKPKDFSRPTAISVICRKGDEHLVFGRTYLAWPWVFRTDGTGTVQDFVVSVDGTAHIKGATVFDPVKPEHRKLFLRWRTGEAERTESWVAALREKCRVDAKLRDLVATGAIRTGGA